MQHNIQISPAACDYIQKRLAKESKLAFRLTVKKTGCSGYSYLPILIDEIFPNDLVIESHGLKVYIDIAWLDLLKELQIDYVEDNKSGIKQKKLTFSNPKEDSRCGCGESFHI